MIRSAVLAILFILRLRLGSNVNVFNTIRSRYGEEGVRLLRKYETLSRKVKKTELDLEFLQKCKIYNVFPKFLRFKLYKRALHTAKFYKAWQSKLLVNEIQSKRKYLATHSDKLSDARELAHSKFSYLDKILIERYISNRISSFTNTTEQVHRRKLGDLGITNELKPCDPNSVVLNYSSITIPQRVKFLLAFGLDFNLPIHKLNFFRYFLHFEQLVGRLSRKTCENLEEFTEKLRSLSCKYFYNFKPYKIFSAIFSRQDIKTLQQFSRNKDVIVCKPDKGKAVVVLDRATYLASMTSLISDTTKFQLIHDSVSKYSQKIEDKINNFLRKLKTMKILNCDIYGQLFTSGSGPGILYGLPKIHKPDFASKFQFRPIFAAYNLPNFKLAQYLVPILKPFTTNQYTVDNSATFVQEIRTINNADQFYMVSFDVENLFTSIPLQETIDICLKLLFDKSTSILGLNISLFKTFLELSVLNSFFYLTVNFINNLTV